jgi:membrane-associated phospholipid phosphatase
MPIGFAVKEIIARPRPIIPESDFLLSVDSQYAFPSGHALMVSAGATLTLVLFRGSKLKLILSLTFALETGLVCFSRVYVGGHYPLDVLGGILLGIAVALILTRFERKLDPLLLTYIRSLTDAWMKRNRTPPSNNNNNIR